MCVEMKRIFYQILPCFWFMEFIESWKATIKVALCNKQKQNTNWNKNEITLCVVVNTWQISPCKNRDIESLFSLLFIEEN